LGGVSVTIIALKIMNFKLRIGVQADGPVEALRTSKAQTGANLHPADQPPSLKFSLRVKRVA